MIPQMHAGAGRFRGRCERADPPAHHRPDDRRDRTRDGALEQALAHRLRTARSMTTGAPYRGVNVFLLGLTAADREYAWPWWAPTGSSPPWAARSAQRRNLHPGGVLETRPDQKPRPADRRAGHPADPCPALLPGLQRRPRHAAGTTRLRGPRRPFRATCAPMRASPTRIGLWTNSAPSTRHQAAAWLPPGIAASASRP